MGKNKLHLGWSFTNQLSQLWRLGYDEKMVSIIQTGCKIKFKIELHF